MSTTGPLNNPIIQPVAPLSPPPRPNPPCPTGINPPPPASPTESEALPSQDQTGRYAETEFDPIAFNAPETLPPDSNLQKMEADLEDLESILSHQVSNDPSSLTPIPADKRENLDALAQSLGFRNCRMLQQQLRNLGPEQVQNLMQTLKAGLNALPKGSNGKVEPAVLQSKLSEVFETHLRTEISQLFTQDGYPAPEFKESGSHWDSASLASVYNALSEIRETSPGKLEVIARSAGQNKNGDQLPLSFNRAPAPPVSTTDNFLDSMNQAMYLAHANQERGEITLSDTAVQADQNEVVRHITGKLDLLTRNLLQDGTPSPEYTPQELAERHLDGNNTTELQRVLLTEYVDKYGGVENLQKAINFITRYRALDRPENVRAGSTPFAMIPEDGNAMSRDMHQLLGRMGPVLLRQVAARMEQTHAVSQLQGFMRESSPYGQRANLSSDGIYGAQTTASVRQFQMTLALNTFKERLEDDKKLSEPQRMEMLHFFESQFHKLEDHPNQFKQIMRDVNTRMQGLLAPPPQVSEDTAQLLQTDLSFMSKLADGIFDTSTASHLVSSWFNVMDSGSGLDMAEQLVSHEVSHLWEHQLDQESNLQVLDNWGRFFEGSDSREDFGVFHMSSQDYHDQTHNDRTASSDYGSISPSEDFAEASRVFTYDPQRLLRRSLLKFLVMNSLQGNPHNSSEILRMAEASGYTREQVQAGLNTVLGYGQNPIRFTPTLASRLDQDYAPLRQALQRTEPEIPHHEAAPHAPDSPTGDSEHGIERTSPDTGLAPANDLRVPENESGWSLDYLQERYNSAINRLNNPQLSQEERRSVQAEIAQFEETFLSQGLEGLQDDKIPAEAKSALDQALNSQEYTGNQALQGRAILLALAKIRAQGYLDLNQEPRLKDYLPLGFQGMLQNQDYLASLTYGQNQGRSVSPTSVTTHALSESHRLDQAAKRMMSQVPMISNWVSGAVQMLTSPLQSESLQDRISSATDSSITAVSQASRIQQLSSNSNFTRAWQLYGKTMETVAHTMGIPLPVPSKEEFARMILSQAGNDTSPQHIEQILRRFLAETQP